MGYLPGTLWLIAGVVLAGAVQDFMVLFISSRRNGRSLGELVREEMGQVAGTIALFGAFLIMIIILAVLALIVVKALADSPWGMFTVLATIPIALFMGVYMRFIRPGRIGEISIIGVFLLLGSIWLGGQVAASPEWAPHFTFSGIQITWMLIGYGAVASVLPVWLLLAPRDYLSTFLKIGTIIGLAIGILIVMPELKMPALTQFTDGTGPVWKGSLFPFLFITIACGAIVRLPRADLLGDHAEAAQPRARRPLHRLRRHADGVLRGDHGDGRRLGDRAGHLLRHEQPAGGGRRRRQRGGRDRQQLGLRHHAGATHPDRSGHRRDHHLARAGGAPTLAVGIAHILHQVLPGENTMAFWYHFAILFEALFILTAVDAGTRAGRFMLQDLLGNFVPALKKTESWTANIIGTGGCVALWGWLLYQGVVDPLGGINTLWPLFGISNQMLAGIALMLATVVLIKMKRQQYVWVTILPAAWLLICTTTAGLIKIFDSNPAVGFVALGEKYATALDAGQVLAPAKDIGQMQHVVLNAYINAGLTVLFLLVVFSVLFYAIKVGIAAWGKSERTDKETPFEPIPDA